jgi:hypothetical protein
MIGRTHEIHLGSIGIDFLTVALQVEGSGIVPLHLLVHSTQVEILEALLVVVGKNTAGDSRLNTAAAI